MMGKVSVSLSLVFYDDSELRLRDSAGESETDVTVSAVMNDDDSAVECCANICSSC